EFCISGTGACVWLLQQATLGCVKGSKISVSMTTDTNSVNTETVCAPDGQTQFIFSDFALVDRTLRSAAWVRIDVPTGTGAYSVRYSLNGMTDALAALAARATAVGHGVRLPSPHPDCFACNQEFMACTQRTHGKGPCSACLGCP